MKTIVLFILAALVAAVFAQLPAGIKEGQKYVVTPELVRDAEPVGKPFKAEECAEIREVTCQYLKKCSKIAKENECLKWETFDVCVQEKVEQYKETKEICVQLETFDKFQPDKCYKCAKKGTEQVTKSRTVCAKYEKQTKCTQRGPRPMCEEYQLVKHCYELTPAYIVEGPKTCPTNQELFFTLQFQGANEKHKIVRQCRPKTNFSKTQCQGTLDPHMRSNKGQNFEFQHTGDFKFIITSDGAFECHVRLQHMIPGTKWTGPSAFACRVNGVDIFYWDQGSFRVNGHPVTVTASSQYNFPEGGHIKLENSGKRVRIVSPNRAELFFDLAATYQNGNEKIQSANFYGLIPSDLGVTGLCAGGDNKQIDHWLKDRAYGLFPFTYEAKILGSAFPEPTFTATERKNAEALCTPIFDPKARKIEFENCVDDILHTNFVNLDATLQAEKDAALNTPNK